MKKPIKSQLISDQASAAAMFDKSFPFSSVPNECSQDDETNKHNDHLRKQSNGALDCCHERPGCSHAHSLFARETKI
jgi:hypothetical protein